MFPAVKRHGPTREQRSRASESMLSFASEIIYKESVVYDSHFFFSAEMDLTIGQLRGYVHRPYTSRLGGIIPSCRRLPRLLLHVRLSWM